MISPEDKKNTIFLKTGPKPEFDLRFHVRNTEYCKDKILEWEKRLNNDLWEMKPYWFEIWLYQTKHDLPRLIEQWPVEHQAYAKLTWA